jgi:hypothetical protein
MIELGPILMRSAEALDRLATLGDGAMHREMDAADPLPDVEEFLALATKLRAAAVLSLEDANLALGQLTKEELGRLELAEHLISSGAFPPDPTEESDRRAVSDALQSLRQRVVDRKSRSGG